MASLREVLASRSAVDSRVDEGATGCCNMPVRRSTTSQLLRGHAAQLVSSQEGGLQEELGDEDLTLRHGGVEHTHQALEARITALEEQVLQLTKSTAKLAKNIVKLAEACHTIFRCQGPRSTSASRTQPEREDKGDANKATVSNNGKRKRAGKARKQARKA